MSKMQTITNLSIKLKNQISNVKTKLSFSFSLIKMELFIYPAGQVVKQDACPAEQQPSNLSGFKFFLN